MTCTGCKANADRTRTAAAMCHTCTLADECVTRSMVFPTVFGKAPTLLDQAPPCPWGRHPDADGVVRWLGLRWYGCPLPIRLRIAAEAAWKAVRERLWGDRELPGCGCIKPLKDRWDAVRHRLKGLS